MTDNSSDNIFTLYQKYILDVNESRNVEEILYTTKDAIEKIFDNKSIVIKIKDNDYAKNIISGFDEDTFKKIDSDEFDAKIEKILQENDGVISNYNLKTLEINVIAIHIRASNIFGFILLPFSDSFDYDLFINIIKVLSYKLKDINKVGKMREYINKNKDVSKRLGVLYEVTNAILGHTKLDDILFILLTSTTLGDAFGFNRAFILLYSETLSKFTGRMGVGPMSGDEANQIWSELNSKSYNDHTSLREKIIDGLSNDNFNQESELNKIFKDVVISTAEFPLFNEITLEKKTINITKIEERHTNLFNHTKIFGNCPFALIPILLESKLLGVIVVDNPYNSEPISNEDLDYIKLFASQASIAIEYANIYNKARQRKRELIDTKDRLSEAQRLATIGEMISSIEHNLRNSIITIGGFASRLNNVVAQDDETKKYTKIIVQESYRLEKYLKQNLSFAKKINLIIEEVNVQKIIEDIETLIENLIDKTKKDINYNISIKNNVDKIYCDYTSINDVIVNLIMNAFDAMPEKDGRIFITIDKHLNLNDKEFVEFRIKNTHSYIEDKNSIFDPFYTTKKKGVGLGLAIAKRIVEGHEGRIEVKSDIENDINYTEFMIMLPILD